MSSWSGISVQRRLAYCARMALTVIGALIVGPSGAPGSSWSPMDPRRTRDRAE
jgi:hypothetical protein